MQPVLLNKQEITNVSKEILYIRIRIPVKLIYKNEKEVKKLVNYMQKFKGIGEIKGNSITGKVLILFDETIICKREIEKHLKFYLVRKNKKINNDIINMSNKNFNQEFGDELSHSLALNYQTSTEISENIDSWHTMKEYEIIKSLLSNGTKGLSNNIAKQRIRELGLNVFSEKKKKSIVAKFIENGNTFSSKLLISVSLFSFIIGQIIDGGVVLGIVFMENYLNTKHQCKAEKSLYSLKNMLVNNSKTKRDGVYLEIEAKYLVPGDIIYLEAGDKVPADSRLLKCFF